MRYPFKQKRLDENTLLREFKNDVPSEELIWHRDRSDRIVEVISGFGWKFQRDNRLPVSLREGDVFKIPAGQYHRLLKGKTDLVDELADTVDDLEAKLNDTTKDAIEMAEELEGYKRDAIIREASKDLAETQVEKLKGLAENVDFEDEDTFAKKVAQLKESYFAKTAKTQEEIIEDDDAPVVEASGSMDSYLKAIKKTATK